MGYTFEQAEQAIRKKVLKDCDKYLAKLNHELAVEWVDMYRLPYRVALDYIKDCNRDNMQVNINPWYPLPKIPLVAELSEEEKTNHREEELKAAGVWLDTIIEEIPVVVGVNDNEDIKRVRFVPCKDERYQEEQKRIDERARCKAEPYKPWNLETEQGIKQWEKYFAVFIVPYEDVLPTFNSFNMFGDTKHNERDLNESKAYYIDLIQRYKKDNKGLFDKAPRTKQLADYDLYNFFGMGRPLPGRGFYMWDGKNVPNHPQALKIMQRELSMYEQANTETLLYDEEISTIKGIIARLES